MANSWQRKETLDYMNKAQQYSPENYKSKYNLDALYNDYMNYGDFKYNQDTDSLYQEYKNRYTDLGNQAMKDTIGQASALTGGYGNSYATAAGQQAYNDYMSALADKGESLRQDAYNEWMQGKQDKYNAWQTAMQADAQDRANWSDNFNHWYGLYSDANSNDYNQWSAAQSEKANNTPQYSPLSDKVYDGAMNAYLNGGEEGLQSWVDRNGAAYGNDNISALLDYIYNNNRGYDTTFGSLSQSAQKQVEKAYKELRNGNVAKATTTINRMIQDNTISQVQGNNIMSEFTEYYKANKGIGNRKKSN